MEINSTISPTRNGVTHISSEAIVDGYLYQSRCQFEGDDNPPMKVLNGFRDTTRRDVEHFIKLGPAHGTRITG